MKIFRDLKWRLWNVPRWYSYEYYTFDVLYDDCRRSMRCGIRVYLGGYGLFFKQFIIEVEHDFRDFINSNECNEIKFYVPSRYQEWFIMNYPAHVNKIVGLDHGRVSHLEMGSKFGCLE